MMEVGLEVDCRDGRFGFAGFDLSDLGCPINASRRVLEKRLHPVPRTDKHNRRVCVHIGTKFDTEKPRADRAVFSKLLAMIAN